MTLMLKVAARTAPVRPPPWDMPEPHRRTAPAYLGAVTLNRKLNVPFFAPLSTSSENAAFSPATGAKRSPDMRGRAAWASKTSDDSG